MYKTCQIFSESHVAGFKIKCSTRFSIYAGFYKDLGWCNTFLDKYDEVTYFENKLPDHTVHRDASVAGVGAVFGNMVYTLPIPYNSYHTA